MAEINMYGEANCSQVANEELKSAPRDEQVLMEQGKRQQFNASLSASMLCADHI
ncbi:hypothetical protein ANO11243_010480 [Dothideomycetidae sp. 11243]|nr:hypothetical protein ANO11243_010480 [fungal sp. No.11243]